MVCGLASSTTSEWEVYANIQEACEEHIKDIGMQVFEIGIDSFLVRVLPSVDDEEISRVLSRLRASGTLDQQTGEWLHFKDKGEPKDQLSHESVVFEPIKDLAKEIITEVSGLTSTKEAQFIYGSRPASIPKSSERRHSSISDGYFVLKTLADDLETIEVPGKPKYSKPWWRNLTLIGEFNKAESSLARNDNVCKVLQGMKYTMGEDPRRRFIHGFTIENATARLWFSDHSQVIVSSPFNFITEASRLVRLLYTFLYSEPAALGWDTSMTVFGHGPTESLTYAVQVGARTFHTFGAQVHNAAVSLVGRGTRVWNVRERLSGGNLSTATYVIKDTWTDADKRREGDVYDILYDLQLPEEEKSVLQRLFLTKLCHDYVMANDLPDITVDLSDLKDQGSVFDIFSKEPIEDPHQQNDMPPMLIRRGQLMHNRIVFEESGTPLHAIESLGQMLRSINDVAAGLYVLHKHGWVHRDISTGNILVCDDGTTKLVDFEFAQRSDDQTTHPKRIGTENFMAVEVYNQDYMFCPAPTVGAVGVAAAAGGIGAPQASRIAFSHNPLHDLESLQWVGIKLIADRQIVSVGRKRLNMDDYSRLDAQHTWARSLFFNSSKRMLLLMSPRQFPDLIQTLDPRVQPLGYFFQKISAALVAQYRLVEKDVGSIDFSAAGDVYGFFRPTMENGVNLQVFEGIRVAHIDYATLKVELNKRRRLH